MSAYRVGIIACGSIAQSEARGWANTPEVQLAALADTNAAARRDFGEAFGIPEAKQYEDYRRMLDIEHLDIISICSWHPLHAEMAIAAAARQPKAILCEKPMATSLAEADAMITAAQRNNVKLAIGHMRRFFSGWEAARQFVADGAIGQPRTVWSTIRQGLLNWGTHTIDGMRFVLGDPAADWVMGAVDRSSDRYERATRIEDASLTLVGFHGGCQAMIENDVTDYGSINFQIIGTDGILDVDENHVKYMNASTGGWRMLDNEQNDPFVGQAHGLIDWLEGRVQGYRGEATQARATLEIMMATYESVRLNEVIRLPLRTLVNPLDLMVGSGQVPVKHPGKYDIRSFLVRGEAMTW